jgi:hypothetical protein
VNKVAANPSLERMPAKRAPLSSDPLGHTLIFLVLHTQVRLHTCRRYSGLVRTGSSSMQATVRNRLMFMSSEMTTPRSFGLMKCDCGRAVVSAERRSVESRG